jgi:alkanesulfonate monooxygenase SsuD/methylene tetrahydromethanopterin reductase-like flavin-dependent oxidoreductase (luciferase family)
MGNKLSFGINPTPHPWEDVKKFDEWCVEVEGLGYDAVLIPDHYDLPVPPFPSNKLVDAWTTLSYVSAKTSSIKVGSLVSPIPRWIPSQLAKIIANVDLLSEGRVIAGFGAGFHIGEFLNYSPTLSWDEDRIKVQKFEEGLRVILKLWTEEKVTFTGKFYMLKDAVLLPKPLQKPHPPIWSGGMGPQMLKLTAKYCDGWIAHRAPSPHRIKSAEDYEARVKAIQNYLKNYGRDVQKFTFAFLLMIGLDVKDMKEASELIEDYSELGCQYFIVEFTPPPPPQKYIELTEKFAQEIIPSFT